MKNNKFGIPVIIILLLVALPATIYALYYNNLLVNEAGNPEHLAIKDGKLYFYNAANELIGYYECETTECAEATPSIEEDEKKNGIYSGAKIGVFNGDKIFIEDNGIKFIKLDKEGSDVIINIKMVKYYDGAIKPYVIYIDENDTYNLLNTDTGTATIVGAQKIVASSKMYTDKFAVGLEGQYGIYTPNNELASITSSLEIVDFTTSYIVYKDVYSGTQMIYDFSGKNEVVSNISDFQFEDEYVIIKDSNGVKIYSPDFTEVLSEKTGSSITFKKEDERVVFYQGTTVIGTYKPGQETETNVDVPTGNNDTPSETND